MREVFTKEKETLALRSETRMTLLRQGEAPGSPPPADLTAWRTEAMPTGFPLGSPCEGPSLREEPTTSAPEIPATS